jgi:hypothetical protein
VFRWYQTRFSAAFGLFGLHSFGFLKILNLDFATISEVTYVHHHHHHHHDDVKTVFLRFCSFSCGICSAVDSFVIRVMELCGWSEHGGAVNLWRYARGGSVGLFLPLTSFIPLCLRCSRGGKELLVARNSMHSPSPTSCWSAQ